MYIIVSVLLLLLCQCAYTLKCSKCSSWSDKLCAMNQRTTTCRNENHDTCYTMTYLRERYDVYEKKHVVRYSVKKGCADSRECRGICERLFDQETDRCKADCCFGNECNKNTDTTRKLSDRNKRRLNDAVKWKSTSLVVIVSIVMAHCCIIGLLS